MKIGFTGTRKGMSASQQSQLHWILEVLTAASTLVDPAVFIYGEATGADREAVAEAEVQGLTIIGYPAGAEPLLRNRRIVQECEVLIAAPETDGEELRSGTWATVRYARAAGKPVVMLSRGVK